VQGLSIARRAWHHQALGGIRPDPAGPGFKQIILKPNIVGGLHWVDCHYDSAHGRILSHWRRLGDQLVMDLTITASAAVCRVRFVRQRKKIPDAAFSSGIAALGRGCCAEVSHFPKIGIAAFGG
jgi:hypothetical protein